MQIRDDVCLGIIAMHRARPLNAVLEDRIARRPERAPSHRSPPRAPEHQSEDAEFRDQYMWMLDEDVVIPDLERRLEDLQRPFVAGNGKVDSEGRVNEWSFARASGIEGQHELGSPGWRRPSVSRSPRDGAVEMEAGEVEVMDRSVSHVVSEMSDVEESRRDENLLALRRAQVSDSFVEKAATRIPLKFWKAGRF